MLQILSQIELTGAEAYALTLADWLASQGHEVHLVSNQLHLPFRGQFHPREIHTSSTLTRIKNVFFLRHLIREKEIQVVHCHSRAAVRVGYWATFGLRVAMVSTVHGRQHSSLSKKLFDQYGDRVIAVCENIRESLIQNFRMNPRKILTLGNPVGAATETKKNQEQASPRVAFIGRFSGPKGMRLKELLEKTFPHLLERLPDLHIDIIGGEVGRMPPELKTAFEKTQSHFPRRLQLIGVIQNLREHYQDYSLVIGSGRVAMEALLREVPCLALGEYGTEGVIRPENYEIAKKSNFGDIGASTLESPVDYSLLTMLLQEALAHPAPDNEKKFLKEAVHGDFSADLVCQDILSVYESAYFQKLHPRHIPVLMYHKIPKAGQNSRHRIFVTAENFEKHLRFFKNQGFTTLSFAELDQYRTLKKPADEFPKRPLILTFDDGYVDNLENAGPLLKKYGMKATIFLLADPNIRANVWDADTGEPPDELMSLEQKRKLKDFNFEIGSHGFRHQKITEMNDAEAMQELSGSRDALEKQLDVHIPVFAYTYGLTSPRAAQLAKRAGYRFAINTDTGGLHMEENPHAIFRTPIFPEDAEPQLRKKTQSWYRKYFYLKRKK